MNRRIFIQKSAVAAALPFFLSGLHACKKETAKQQRIFIIIQLIGGNDGVNTLISLDKYKQITAARPNLFIPEKKVLALKGTSITGLHPALEGIKDLYDNGLIGFVQGVGYENQNYSHFRSADIWLTGSGASTVLYTGWMARYLETRYKNYPEGFPNSLQSDPPAIKIGDTGTYLFQGNKMDMSIVIDPSTTFNTPDIDDSDNDTTSYAGQEVRTIREILLQTERYSKTIQRALGASFSHSGLYPQPGENSLADQLKTVAQLINGGLQTSVYLVELKGFDTHADQVDHSDTTKGSHADLLKKLSQAITCFWDDITHLGRENDVAGMTFSEFGRRIVSNAAYGTDHGASQPIMFFGSNIQSGIIGVNPITPDKVTVNDNLEVQFDFRAIYASILKSWMNAPIGAVNDLLYGNYPEMKIFKS